MRSDRERLLNIVEAIEKIFSHKEISRLDYESDELVQVWYIHYLQMIGEAASRLSEDMRIKNPEVQWDQMIGMRHILVHGYFEVDL